MAPTTTPTTTTTTRPMFSPELNERGQRHSPLVSSVFGITSPDRSDYPADGTTTASTANPSHHTAKHPAKPTMLHYRLYGCEYCSYKSKYRADVCKHQGRKHKDQPKAISVMKGLVDSQENRLVTSRQPGSTLPITALPAKDPPHHQPQSHVRCQRAGRMECNVCLKFGTYSSEKFYIHMAAHQNLKPFKCSFCGQRANYKSDVQKHIRNRKKYESHEATVEVLAEDEAKSTIDAYILERHRHSTHRRKRRTVAGTSQQEIARVVKKEVAVVVATTNNNAAELNPKTVPAKLQKLDLPTNWSCGIVKSDHFPWISSNLDPQQQQHDNQHSSTTSFKRFKCNSCFFRSGAVSSISSHVASFGHSSFHEMTINDAQLTIRDYNRTFDRILSCQGLSEIVQFSNDPFPVVLNNIANHLLDQRKLLGFSPMLKQTVSEPELVKLDQMFVDFFNIYVSYYPERYDGIISLTHQIEAIISAVIKQEAIKKPIEAPKRKPVHCSICDSEIDCQHETYVDHLALHLRGGCLKCSMCSFTSQFYKMALVHNNKAHGGQAKMKILGPASSREAVEQ